MVVVATSTLLLPASLTSFHRLIIHSACTALGLTHVTEEEGEEEGGGRRRIRVETKKGEEGGEVEYLLNVAGDKPRGDEEWCALVALLEARCGVPKEVMERERNRLEKEGERKRTQRTKGKGEDEVSLDTLGISSSKASSCSCEGWAERTKELLALERAAEVAAAEEEVAKCSLRKLTLLDSSSGLLGRTIYKFGMLAAEGGSKSERQERAKAEEEGKRNSILAVKLSPSDIVALRPNRAAPASPPLATGLVTRVTQQSISVVLEEALGEEGGTASYRVDKLANDVTYKRMCQTVDSVGTGMSGEKCERLIRLAFQSGGGRGAVGGGEQPRFQQDASFQWTPLNSCLDASQRHAVALCLRANDIGLIHGPPGTGKTTALIEVLRQEVQRGRRILCCAASNIAVDNLCERVVALEPEVEVVRVGHPARLLPSVVQASLEAKVACSDDKGLSRDCRRDIAKLNTQLTKVKKKAERREIYNELKLLRKDARKWDTIAVSQVLKKAQIILCTLSVAADSKQLKDEEFDVVIIDEAAQALEAAAWAGVVRSSRVIMAGDHLQLPPTITSDEAKRQGLEVTLFQRLIGSYPQASCMLTVQYRMHADIMQWSSDELYEGKLTAHPSVAKKTIRDLFLSSETGTNEAEKKYGEEEGGGLLEDIDDGPLALIDTAGCDMWEELDQDSGSRSNCGEAKIVASVVRTLLHFGLQNDQIGVISPYAAQVSLLRQLLEDMRVECSTVDGFQGREKEVIIISTVRCNTTGEVGFLSDERRMNVAVTRARKLCVLVGDSETLTRHDKFLKRLIGYFEEKADCQLSAQSFDECM